MKELYLQYPFQCLAHNRLRFNTRYYDYDDFHGYHLVWALLTQGCTDSRDF